MASRYTEAEQQLIRDLYATHSLEETSRLIYERFGTQRSVSALDGWMSYYSFPRSKRYHKKKREVRGGSRRYTTASRHGTIFLTELARELGVLEKTMRHFAKVRRLGRPHVDGRIMLNAQEAEAARAYYAAPPWEALTSHHAARLLQVSVDTVESLAKRGVLASHKQGRNLLVKQDDVTLEMVCRRLLPPSAYQAG